MFLDLFGRRFRSSVYSVRLCLSVVRKQLTVANHQGMFGDKGSKTRCKKILLRHFGLQLRPTLRVFFTMAMSWSFCLVSSTLVWHMLFQVVKLFCDAEDVLCFILWLGLGLCWCTYMYVAFHCPIHWHSPICQNLLSPTRMTKSCLIVFSIRRQAVYFPSWCRRIAASLLECGSSNLAHAKKCWSVPAVIQPSVNEPPQQNTNKSFTNSTQFYFNLKGQNGIACTTHKWSAGLQSQNVKFCLCFVILLITSISFI